MPAGCVLPAALPAALPVLLAAVPAGDYPPGRLLHPQVPAAPSAVPSASWFQVPAAGGPAVGVIWFSFLADAVAGGPHVDGDLIYTYISDAGVEPGADQVPVFLDVVVPPAGDLE